MALLNTAQKIAVATALYQSVSATRKLFGKSDSVMAKRRGINWQLDLKEGIDFAIYLLGGFEINTLRFYESVIKEGDVVLDIGANVGAHTLPFAKLVGSGGKVHAFEPTQYAFGKLQQNAQLNPALRPQMELHHAMLVRDSNQAVSESLYSSWPLQGKTDLHETHGGRLMSTAGAQVISLDDFVRDSALTRIDFIKLDVDGHEIAVLSGAAHTIARFRPMILMELAPYLFADSLHELEKIMATIVALGYEIRDVDTKQVLPTSLDQLIALVPKGGSKNILFQPKAVS